MVGDHHVDEGTIEWLGRFEAGRVHRHAHRGSVEPERLVLCLRCVEALADPVEALDLS